MSGCGFPAPGAEIFLFEDIFTLQLASLEFGFSKVTVLLLLGVVAVVGFFTYAFRKPKLVPRGAQNIGEVGYVFVRDGIAKETIGHGGEKFVPFLFSFFFFVWVLNFFGILPGAQLPATSIFAIPVAFALIVYFTWVPLGMIKQGPIKFFTNMMFPPGVPKPMYILLAPIELISNILVRPFTHAVRLFANMFAGHLLLATFSIAAFYLISASVIGILGSVASFVVTVALTGFEAFIQALQAYIFTLLAAVYIGSALHAEH
ncbi:MAG: F0F1 ATP synthase subunit A [Actinomycetota bacterium]|jgi:F-type H+-transporting ATPase subunit a|nr:ATP synthase F0 subunit A [Actinomycetota bacterium]NDA50583.1 ATP synthase F0 subunit A [Actinomycetota bacterium]NDA58340.1 ATP synthase F0 subunit A [Actinomycetota bacterium]NDH14640.1 ATP synthase F0 subunit A [Actinomycetota bacterium]NDH18342.1 ATP synthase F0 subunit A [Actinomycetota bacterium]|tara:strand:- start:394 stop:1173 length:780 start_codon:yes stop_codon:yes gene_type:complete